jgi:hypothetical protein
MEVKILFFMFLCDNVLITNLSGVYFICKYNRVHPSDKFFKLFPVLINKLFSMLLIFK